jgi:hypothetical protein
MLKSRHVPVDAFEFVFAAVEELDVGSGDEVSNGPCDQDLTRRGMGGDALSDVDCDSANVIAAQFDLAGVETSAYLHAERADRVADRARASDRAAGPVEGCQHTVTGGFDLPAAVPLVALVTEKLREKYDGEGGPLSEEEVAEVVQAAVDELRDGPVLGHPTCAAKAQTSGLGTKLLKAAPDQRSILFVTRERRLVGVRTGKHLLRGRSGLEP